MSKIADPRLLAQKLEQRRAGGRAVRRAAEAMARKEMGLSVPAAKAIIRRNKARKAKAGK